MQPSRAKASRPICRKCSPAPLRAGPKGASFMRYGVVFALVAALAVFTACTKQSTTTQGSTTIQGSNGPVTITQDQGSKSVTFQSKEGTAKLGVGAVDPQSLGLPIYPGAQPNGNGSLSSETSQGKSQMLTMETADPFDKVYAFYKDKMP